METMKTLLAFTLLLAGFVGKVNGHFDIKKLDVEQPINGGKIWAFLVAGSNGIGNYRHQADVAHAYQLLKKHGVDENQIIVMMYDDVVNSTDNPHPGKLYNKPDGDDVYKGIKIDYRGDDVNPQNFLAVLQGQKDKVSGGNGRVLGSTKDDKVFVFFSDHGGVGVICMINDVITKKQLNDALKQMHKNKHYKELTFYLEACESGSMFEEALPKNMNIYAVTASNGHESSWSCYCDSKLLPHNCLGDCFSVHWMEDSEKEDLQKETLQKQFKIVKEETNTSHVLQFGNFKITKETISQFQGNKKTDQIGLNKDNTENYKKWPARDVPLMQLESKLKRTNDLNEKALIADQLNEIRQKRKYLDLFVGDFVKKLVPTSNDQYEILNGNSVVTQLDCHDEVVHEFNDNCFNFGKNPYAMSHVKVLANLCERRIDSKLIVNTLKENCVDLKYQNIV